MSLGSNGVDRKDSLRKFRRDFVSRTFTLIAPVWRIMHQVSCSSETVLKAPKWKETHQNMRLGSNGIDRERSLGKILSRHRGTNFCINCTSLVCFRAIAKRFQKHPNGKKRTKKWVYCPMVWIVSVRCKKLWHDFVARTFTLIAPVWHVLHQVSCSSETVPNEPKRKETHQNIRLGPNGMNRERSLFILTRHHGTNFCINCTSLARFAASFVS